MARVGVRGMTIEAEALISAAQDLTDGWVDLGAEIETARYGAAGLWLNVDINSSANVRIRALAKHTRGGSEEYSLPIRTVGSSDVKIEAEYFELNTDADQQVLLTIDLDSVIPWVQFQVMAGTVGATAGQIDTAYVTKGY